LYGFQPEGFFGEGRGGHIQADRLAMQEVEPARPAGVTSPAVTLLVGNPEVFIIELGYNPRATVQTCTSCAPAFRKARAQALVVAPVVRTSSTKITRRPSSWQPDPTAKAWRTLAARCSRVSNV